MGAPFLIAANRARLKRYRWAGRLPRIYPRVLLSCFFRFFISFPFDRGLFFFLYLPRQCRWSFRAARVEDFVNQCVLIGITTMRLIRIRCKWIFQEFWHYPCGKKWNLGGWIIKHYWARGVYVQLCEKHPLWTTKSYTRYTLGWLSSLPVIIIPCTFPLRNCESISHALSPPHDPRL